MTQEEQIKKIKAEERKLLQLFKDIPEKKREVAKRIIKKAAYQCVMLDELQEDIFKNGTYEMFQQGEKQTPYERQRPIVGTYTSMTSSYQKYMKQLTDLLPKETAAAGDGFEDFINDRKD